MTQTLQQNDDGDRIELGPNEVVIRLSSDDTDGAFSLIEYSSPPDGPAPPFHVHEQTDEVVYVLDGEVECKINEETMTAVVGETVWIPRGTPHTFSVVGSIPGWFLIWYAPGGFESYFEEMGEFLQSLPPGPPDMDAVGQKAAELCNVYDQTILETDR